MEWNKDKAARAKQRARKAHTLDSLDDDLFLGEQDGESDFIDIEELLRSLAVNAEEEEELPPHDWELTDIHSPEILAIEASWQRPTSTYVDPDDVLDYDEDVLIAAQQALDATRERRRDEYFYLFCRILGVTPTLLNNPYLYPAQRRYLQRKYQLARRLLDSYLPCPRDNCGRPYQHPIHLIRACIDSPWALCNPYFLLRAIRRELLIMEYRHLLRQDDQRQLAVDQQASVLAEKLSIPHETARLIVLDEPLMPRRLPRRIALGDPLLSYQFNEYLNRQTPWGIRKAFARRRSELVSQPKCEFDIAAHQQWVDEELARLDYMTLISPAAQRLAPIDPPDVSDMDTRSASEALETWQCADYNRRRALAELLNINLAPTLTCSAIPVVPHLCWWDTPEQQEWRDRVPPLTSTFWYIYNFHVNNFLAPVELERRNSIDAVQRCQPNMELVQYQLEFRRPRVPKHKITPALRLRWARELDEAMAQFQPVYDRQAREAARWEAFDKRLSVAIKKLRVRRPHAYPNAPIGNWAGDPDPVAMPSKWTQEIPSPRAHLATLTRPYTPSLQEAELEPVFISPCNHWGSYQQALYRSHIDGAQSAYRRYGDKLIQRLWAEYQTARLRGDTHFYGRLLSEWIFPKIESPTQFSNDPDEFYRRKERIDKIRRQARQHRAELLHRLRERQAREIEDDDS